MNSIFPEVSIALKSINALLSLINGIPNTNQARSSFYFKFFKEIKDPPKKRS